VGWVDTELALVALAAMVSPTTLTFSVLALVLGDRPLRTGVWFYLGAFGAALLIGVVAAFVLGDFRGALLHGRTQDVGLDLRHRRRRRPAHLCRPHLA
jgi:hypothetical protein